MPGDLRVNEQPTLGVMHLLWVREHNRLARQLKRINPHWNDERLYLTLVKIIINFLTPLTHGGVGIKKKWLFDVFVFNVNNWPIFRICENVLRWGREWFKLLSPIPHILTVLTRMCEPKLKYRGTGSWMVFFILGRGPRIPWCSKIPSGKPS